MARAAYGLPGRGPHSGRWIAMSAAIAVLVMAAAAAMLALAHGRARDGSPRPDAGANRAAGQSGHSAAPSTPAIGQTQAPPLVSGQRIAVTAQAAASQHARTAVLFLTRYFTAINAHDYLAYRRLFSPEIRGGLSRAAFGAGYSTTRDSLATLRNVGVIGTGQLAAVVTFTSHQNPAQSPSRSGCTRWRISLYLIRQGNEYLLQTPPSGYRASFRACS